MKNSKVEFTPPQDLVAWMGSELPEDTNIELMVNFRTKGNGQWCIASVEGVPFPGYDAQGNPSEEASEHMKGGSEFSERYEKEMSGG